MGESMRPRVQDCGFKLCQVDEAGAEAVAGQEADYTVLSRYSAPGARFCLGCEYVAGEDALGL